ncbi:MAG: hypothetical protein Q4B43_04690, partial [Bacteroidota bacterium]|nr:hypothetical protein [Bacteroidota bacterium]
MKNTKKVLLGLFIFGTTSIFAQTPTEPETIEVPSTTSEVNLTEEQKKGIAEKQNELKEEKKQLD